MYSWGTCFALPPCPPGHTHFGQAPLLRAPPRMCAPRRASQFCPLHASRMHHGAFLEVAPVSLTVVDVQAERSWAAVRSPPARSDRECVLCCRARGHSSSGSRFQDALARSFCEAEGTGPFSNVLQAAGPEPSAGCPSNRRARPFLSSPGRPARESLLGFRLGSCR